MISFNLSDVQYKFLPLVLFLIGLSHCQPVDHKVTPAFYHWQTHLNLTEVEQQLLQDLNIRTLYVKFFDVDWDFVRQQAVPKATVQITPKLDSSLRIIPTIFITNRTFLHIPEQNMDTLVGNVYKKLKFLANRKPIQEIQIDCDWTNRTRIQYFTFLNKLKERFVEQAISLSATIRLHQFKYPDETGIPPVSKGMLMVYNVGELENWAEPNSILALKTLKPYLSSIEAYPIKLDLALPIFAWGVVYRGPKLIKLINNLRYEMLDTHSYVKQLAENRYELTKSSYINGYYLYEGDRIRTERISPELLIQTSNLLAKNRPFKQFNLAFYHLDTSTIKHYQNEHFRQVISIFEH